MTYLVFLLLLCFGAGVVGVAAHPAPYFGVLGLVVGAAAGCGVLVSFGGSFGGLVLFLIYLGGMLVVFVYSTALAAEAYPVAWGDWSVLLRVGGFVLVGVLGAIGSGVVVDGGSGAALDGTGLFDLRGDFSGIVLLFSGGGGVLLVCGLGLLLALFVVLELTRGCGRGGLRTP
uniref:NADH-ubiquinone oxidoreductase chain 6 n=1 Tax=Cnemaspis limi TaxID=460617 RepID=K9JW38_CNELI|nr:NADH dehydrogenase subunit 6 [Cnemaspis limi]ADY86106.1 NADH dehydrogenase subunit 6 [Cnemaspis limi]